MVNPAGIDEIVASRNELVVRGLGGERAGAKTQEPVIKSHAQPSDNAGQVRKLLAKRPIID